MSTPRLRPAAGRSYTRAWRRLRRRGALPLVAIGAQVVPLLALVALTGRWLAPFLGALWLNGAFFAARAPYSFRSRGPLHLYLGLWPFFAWWTACLVFTCLSPLAMVATFAGLAPAASFGGAGAIAAGFGLAGVRRTPRVTRVTLQVPGLPEEFDGYRVAQVSDVHCGLFAPERRVRDWARRTRALGADLIAVTGDLIARGDRYVDQVGAALGELRARDGVFACMGNHDYYCDGERLVRALRAGGIEVLRNEAVRVSRGGAEIAVAGVDDTWSERDDLARALAGLPADLFVLLLAHDPDLFPQAVEREVPLTLSGHTHGGQLAVPVVAKRYNLARLATVFTSGLYRRGRSLLYVNRGAGTSGPPIRIGTRAEIALFTLRCRRDGAETVSPL